jgi:hypothetical protein
MLSERKAVRDAIKACLTEAFTYPVYAEREIDGRGHDEFVNVFMTDGEASYEGLVLREEANVTVSFRSVRHLTDDELDERMDAIGQTILEHDFGSVMQGINYAGFEYHDERDRGFDGMSLRFAVVF